MQAHSTQKSQLARRHITMISMGGVVGAGLFVGSGQVIGHAGPGALFGYLAAGILVVIIIRMLAEMASARPTLGSFADYARDSLGDWAGYTTGWLYIYQWVTAIALEAIAAADIARIWMPGVPLWALALVVLTALTAINLLSSRSFGEIETWLSVVKVGAIIIFIGLAAFAVFGLSPQEVHTNSLFSGDWMPSGFGGIVAVVPIAIMSYYGSEVATIAAAESSEPRASIARAANTVVIRVLAFYVVSLTLITILVPWSDAQAMKSPFASALDVIGIPGAQTAMNLVVMVALLSVLNSGIYASSRMIFALAHRRDAPRPLLKTNKRGLPWRAVLFVVSPAYVAVAGAAIFPTKIVPFLLSSAGAIAILVWLSIAVSHYRMRRELDKDHLMADRLKLPFFPFLSFVAIAGLIGVLIGMAVVKESRSQLALTLCTFAFVLLSFAVKRWRERRYIKNFVDEVTAIAVVEAGAAPPSAEDDPTVLSETR